MNPSDKCPACGRAIEDDWTICPQCRAFLLRKCRNCGRTLRVHWVFCPRCGAADSSRPLAGETT
ncbi:MAG: zinc ribbon domain-containing protein [Dehalococcoidia bacterium]